MSQTHTAAARTDLAGMALAGLCLAHCLLFPVLAALLPAFGALAEIEWLHWLLVGLVTPAAALMIRDALSIPGRRGIAVQGTIGLALLLAAVLVPISEAQEKSITVLGGLLLAGAHLRRWRAHRAVTDAADTHRG